jgi:hypothetical protein
MNAVIAGSPAQQSSSLAVVKNERRYEVAVICRLNHGLGFDPLGHHRRQRGRILLYQRSERRSDCPRQHRQQPRSFCAGTLSAPWPQSYAQTLVAAPQYMRRRQKLTQR